MPYPIILAIESSCDDTSVALIEGSKVLSNMTATQHIHIQYGGVVPEVASRAHQQYIVPVADQAMKQAGKTFSELDAIAVTRGPGLMGALIVGLSYAKGLALALDIPLIDVHHMRAHVLAHFAEKPYPQFPFLCLTVSGGHTQILRVNSAADMQILGQTLDDAAGEAFDKTGKLMGLDYPAGPQIDKLAMLGSPTFSFPEPKVDGLDFSFSGLKTSVRYFLQKEMKKNPQFIRENLNDLCASIQERIVSILIKKLEKAVELTNISEVAIAGGVSANSSLRAALKDRPWNTFVPKLEYCTDNAAMVAIAARFAYEAGEFASHDMAPEPRMEI